MALEQGRHWTPPEGFAEAQRAAVPLPCLFNSLTDTKQPLVPSAGPDSRCAGHVDSCTAQCI